MQGELVSDPEIATTCLVNCDRQDRAVFFL